MYPVVPMNARILSKNVTVGGYQFSKNVGISKVLFTDM